MRFMIARRSSLSPSRVCIIRQARDGGRGGSPETFARVNYPRGEGGRSSPADRSSVERSVTLAPGLCAVFSRGLFVALCGVHGHREKILMSRRGNPVAVLLDR